MMITRGVGRTCQATGSLYPARRSGLSRRIHLGMVLEPKGQYWRTLEQGRWCAPVPRRNTQMWLMVSAAGNSKAAFVSSICCIFVCKSLPATQQPNIVQRPVNIGGVEWGRLSILLFLFLRSSSLFVSVSHCRHLRPAHRSTVSVSRHTQLVC